MNITDYIRKKYLSYKTKIALFWKEKYPLFLEIFNVVFISCCIFLCMCLFRPYHWAMWPISFAIYFLWQELKADIKDFLKINRG